MVSGTLSRIACAHWQEGRVLSCRRARRLGWRLLPWNRCWAGRCGSPRAHCVLVRRLMAQCRRLYRGSRRPSRKRAPRSGRLVRNGRCRCRWPATDGRDRAADHYFDWSRQHEHSFADVRVSAELARKLTASERERLNPKEDGSFEFLSLPWTRKVTCVAACAAPSCARACVAADQGHGARGTADLTKRSRTRCTSACCVRPGDAATQWRRSKHRMR